METFRDIRTGGGAAALACPAWTKAVWRLASLPRAKAAPQSKPIRASSALSAVPHSCRVCCFVARERERQRETERQRDRERDRERERVVCAVSWHVLYAACGVPGLAGHPCSARTGSPSARGQPALSAVLACPARTKAVWRGLLQANKAPQSKLLRAALRDARPREQPALCVASPPPSPAPPLHSVFHPLAQRFAFVSTRNKCRVPCPAARPLHSASTRVFGVRIAERLEFSNPNGWMSRRVRGPRRPLTRPGW